MELLKVFRNWSFPPSSPCTKLKIRCYVVPLVQWSSASLAPPQSTLKKVLKIDVSLSTFSSSHLKTIWSYIQILPKDVFLFCTNFCFGFLSSLAGPCFFQSLSRKDSLVDWQWTCFNLLFSCFPKWIILFYFMYLCLML